MSIRRLFLFLYLMFGFSFFANADGVALNFNGVPLPSFVRVAYRDMLNRDFVMSTDLQQSDRPVSVSVKSVESSKLAELIDSVLIQQGVKSTFRDGVWNLSLADSSFAPGLAVGLAKSAGGGDLPGSSGSALGLVASGPVSVDLEHFVFKPVNRKPEFLSLVMNSLFNGKSAVVAGGLLVLSVPKDSVKKAQSLCEQLDVRSPKVRLSATFVEVSNTSSSNLGVSVIADVLGARLGLSVGDTSSGSLTLKTNRFQAVIDALASDGRFKQVASPSAVVDDDEKSMLSFGDSVPTIGSTTLDKNGNPNIQVQYQQSGVVLNVQPAVLGSGRINVVVDGQVSSFSKTTNGVNGSPTLSKRQVQTAVTVDDGELLMIGGLNDSRLVGATSGLSFLPETWRGKSSSSSNTDLVLILSASVIK